MVERSQKMDKTYICPSLPEGACKWEGKAEEIVNHFETYHKNVLIKTNEFDLDISKNYEKNLLMVFKSETYLLQMSMCQDVIVVKLRYLGSQLKANQKRYYIEICAENGTISSNDLFDDYKPLKNNNGVIEIDVDVLKFIWRLGDSVLCRVRFEKLAGTTIKRRVSRGYAKSAVNRAGSFSLKYICPDDSYFDESRERFEQDSFDGKRRRQGLLLKKNSILQDYFYEENTTYKPNSNDQFALKLQLIMCTNCTHHMIPPIFMCSQGHSVCFSCLNHSCKLCGGKIMDVRNEDLEEISKTLLYPCRFKNKGCILVASGLDIQQHEIQCKYCQYKCPICAWDGKFTTIEQHFRIVHPSIKKVTALENPFPPDAGLLIVNATGIFYCKSTLNNSTMEWNVLYCGKIETSFRCEVVVNGKKSYQKIFRLNKNGNMCSLRISLTELKLAKLKKTELKIKNF